MFLLILTSSLANPPSDAGAFTRARPAGATRWLARIREHDGLEFDAASPRLEGANVGVDTRAIGDPAVAVGGAPDLAALLLLLCDLCRLSGRLEPMIDPRAAGEDAVECLGQRAP